MANRNATDGRGLDSFANDDIGSSPATKLDTGEISIYLLGAWVVPRQSRWKGENLHRLFFFDNLFHDLIHSDYWIVIIDLSEKQVYDLFGTGIPSSRRFAGYDGADLSLFRGYLGEHLVPDSNKNPETESPDWSDLKANRDYEAIFARLEPEWQIAIERMRPSWCEGWCETIHHDPHEPIDLDYIRETWGGQRFKLIVRDQNCRYVTNVYIRIDGEPRRFGKRIPHPDEVDHTRQLEARRLEYSALEHRPPAQPAIDPTIGKMLTDAISQLGSNKDDQMKFFMELAKKQIGKEPEGRRDVKELMEIAESMQQLHGLFGGAGEGGSDDLFTANAGRFLDILDRKAKQDEQKGQQQQSQGQQRQIRIVKNLGRGDTVSAPAEPPADLSSTLAHMTPVDACAVFTGALMKMSPQARAEVSEILMGEYDDSDDDDETDDNESDDTTEKVS